ncbi:MAG TPA: BPL-N domain-containing protein, partial [Methanobacterium sp.]
FITVFILVFTIPFIINYETSLTNKKPATTFASDVNVLIYDGEGSSTDSVDGLIYCLEEANKNNYNINFVYSTADVINSDVLSSQDVLIISGGDIELLFNDPTISPADIKAFVREGKGYLGICAGAYVASNYQGEYGSGWGISPHINATYTDYDGQLPLTITSYGINTLKYSDCDIFVFNKYCGKNIDQMTIPSFPMSNTPALYKNGNYSSIAIYADNNSFLDGYAAILDDTYGSGRIILSGPHPELDPAKPELVARMVAWVSKKI